MNRHKILSHWLPLLLWLILIFSLSHQAKEETEQTSGLILTFLKALGMSIAFIEKYEIHFYVRKLAHFTEYFVLCLLFFRVCNLYLDEKRALILSWVLAVLNACGDEWHQRFVPGRGAAISDVLIDASGAALAALLLAYFLSRNNQKIS